ncbi:LITAF-like zinc ribbon domain-containing protein [Aspergillus cavernicola]|uniref:LITAF-like zinc ribbon domain-containing protein n=1 Tax=Aspergillus cavernicola TaxID=176166 RepID=A0ABR4HQQ5_9EURO
MSEKANYTAAPQGPAPPTYQQHPTNTGPVTELDTQQPRATTDPGPEIQLQNIPPQDYPNYPQPSEPTKQVPDASNPGPQMYPPQQYAPALQSSQYPTATPLHALQRTPQAVDCPVCHEREMTRTQGVNGNTTHAWAAVLCCCACLGCVPYLAAAFKDVDHMCGKCGYVLATYHNSGHVVVHGNPAPPAKK